MKTEHKEIISIISEYFDKNPEARFGQGLFNLDINQFTNPNSPETNNHKVKDIHSDSDKAILTRLRQRAKHLKIEVNKNEDCKIPYNPKCVNCGFSERG